MADKFLRGKAPLTVWRGVDGSAGGHLYRGGLLDPNAVDVEDRKRLVAEGFLELVVRDGEAFKLAEDTASGAKGDPVTVGDNGLADPAEKDPGMTNTTTEPVADPDLEAKRADARAKLTDLGGTPDGRSSEAVWIEYAVSKGTDRAEAEKAGKAALMDLFKR